MRSERKPNFRTKVYQSGSGSEWEDQGIGHCVYEQGVNGDPDMLVVKSETEERIILYSNVFTSKLFHQIRHTEIVWTAEDGTEMVLSFQDTYSCNIIWQSIQEGREKFKDNKIKQATPQSSNVSMPSQTQGTSASSELPDLQLYTLKQITKRIMSNLVIGRMNMINRVHSNDYINKLVVLFQSIDPKDPSYQMDVQNMFDFLLALLALKERRIIEKLIHNSNIYTVIQILEFDTASSLLKVNHRRQLRRAEKAKKLVEFRSEEVEDQIRKAIRLSYINSMLQQFNCWGETPHKLKEVMSLLDEMYHSSCNKIVKYIQDADYFLHQLFMLPKEDPKKQEDVMKYVIELYIMSQNMLPSEKDMLIKKMANFDLLDILVVGLNSGAPHISKNAAEAEKKKAAKKKAEEREAEEREAEKREAEKREAEKREAEEKVEEKEVEEVEAVQAEIAEVEVAGSRRKRSSSEAEVEDSDRPHKDIRLDEDKPEMPSQLTASSSQKRSSHDAGLEDDGRSQKGARLGRK
ncbi:component of IIS longevity pathway SMK-1-domain-containing protein [Blakeslea trispora]|nr:component of IIS longevity pathway SMK-1-domain-containing protein [Blakeslea trispora]